MCLDRASLFRNIIRPAKFRNVPNAKQPLASSSTDAAKAAPGIPPRRDAKVKVRQLKQIIDMQQSFIGRLLVRNDDTELIDEYLARINAMEEDCVTTYESLGVVTPKASPGQDTPFWINLD